MALGALAYWALNYQGSSHSARKMMRGRGGLQHIKHFFCRLRFRVRVSTFISAGNKYLLLKFSLNILRPTYGSLVGLEKNWERLRESLKLNIHLLDCYLLTPTLFFKYTFRPHFFWIIILSSFSKNIFHNSLLYHCCTIWEPF